LSGFARQARFISPAGYRGQLGGTEQITREALALSDELGATVVAGRMALGVVGRALLSRVLSGTSDMTETCTTR
jgi:hypothetical protein